MYFDDACDAVNELMAALPKLFADAAVSFVFGKDRLPIGDWSDPTRIGMLVSRDEIGSRSGVYLFSSSAGDVIYIGKAGKDNLHKRIWHHVQTPAPLTQGRYRFPNHRFKSELYCTVLQQEIEDGRVNLGVITVSDPNLAPVVEVYLQTLHMKLHGRLPKLNLQIG